MGIYPGATFKPSPWGGEVKRNRQGRGILHVAVNDAQELAPWNGNTWHFYVGHAAPDGSTDGSGGPAVCTQYKDTEFRAYGDVDANDDALVVETAGGRGSSAVLNAQGWTRAAQLRIIDLMRWEAGQPGGAPLALLPDSKPGRQGWGPHRLGIKHSAGLVKGWWAPGGEVWSSALGKECPGDAKVAQIPGLITEAWRGSLVTAEEDDVARFIFITADDKSPWFQTDGITKRLVKAGPISQALIDGGVVGTVGGKSVAVVGKATVDSIPLVR